MHDVRTFQEYFQVIIEKFSNFLRNATVYLKDISVKKSLCCLEGRIKIYIKEKVYYLIMCKHLTFDIKHTEA